MRNSKKKKDLLGSYIISKFPKTRIPTLDFLKIGEEKHYVKGLIELDVSKAREKIQVYESNEGTKLSFTAWLLTCIGHAISNHPEVQTIRYKKKKLINFEDVDISIVVEKKVGDKKVPMPLIIRKANEKSVLDIHREIREAQKEEKQDAAVLGESSMNKKIKVYVRLPGFLRRFIIKRMLKNPFTFKKQMGTVLLTAVGMFSKFHGWPITAGGVHPLKFAVGGISKKPIIVENEIRQREMLTLTILFDHEIIDGGPATRFSSELGEMIENAFGLEFV
ncbi:MAG: dihydrolipoamide acyltransferase [Candidatus Lokiarchaeota archaeon]|nr:dihydrolipoamide acyltransferase [Candidatus Lokiarchaeota archaeon]MBD3200490.1 dihydrolipoamide acyltransferase [Candidatus Lokiarchaeota archaeon]